jgi:hypothetical protein
MSLSEIVKKIKERVKNRVIEYKKYLDRHSD